MLISSARFDFVALMALIAELLYSNTQLIIIFFKFYLFYSDFFLYFCTIKFEDMKPFNKLLLGCGIFTFVIVALFVLLFFVIYYETSKLIG